MPVELMPAPKKKKPLTMLLRLDAETATALAEFLASHDTPPKRNPVIVTALRAYLKERGHWPPKPKPEPKS